MKKKGPKPIIKSKVIIEGSAENSFMKNKLPKIIHDLEKFTKRELKVILSPSLNVSTTNIFKNFEPLPKETPKKNLKNIVSSTPYCGRYVNTHFTANSSLPSPIHVGSFKRNRYNRIIMNSSSSESSSVVYVGTEVNNDLNTCENVKKELRPEKPKSCNLLDVNRSVEISGREQLQTDEAHQQSKSPDNKQKMLVEASHRGHNGQNQVKQQELSHQRAQRSIRNASLPKSSNKKKVEVSLEPTIAVTKRNELAKDHTQSSFKADKRRKQQLDASDQHPLEAVETADSQHSQSKTNNRNVSIANNSRATRSACRSATRLPEGDAKNQFASEESSIVLKMNENRSRFLRSGRAIGILRAAGEPEDFERSGIQSKQMVDEPTKVRCRTVEVNTEVPPLDEGDAGKLPDNEDSCFVLLSDIESTSRHVTSRSKRPDGTIRAAKKPDDFGNILEQNLKPQQMVGRIEVQHKTVHANTQTSPSLKLYMSEKRSQNGFKGSFKNILSEMEKQARLKLSASAPAWTQTSGLTLEDNVHSDNGAEGLGSHIIQEITAKKTQMMCDIRGQNPIKLKATKDKSSAAVGLRGDESRVAARVGKSPFLNNSVKRSKERRTVDFSPGSLRKERAKINQKRLVSFENLINKLEAKALLVQESETSDSAVTFNGSVSSNRRFKPPKKSSMSANENLGFSSCSSRHNKSRESAKKNLNSIIGKLVVKSAERKNVAKKSTQTTCLGVDLLQVSPANQKPETVAPSLRRSVMKQSCEHLKNIRNNRKSSIKQSESSPAPNIYDSVLEGNVADCLTFSALSDACFAEYHHKPWRCSEVTSPVDTFPRLSFIRSEAAIAADALHGFDNNSDDESSDSEVNHTRTNNVSLAPSKVSASKGKPHCRRYSKGKARNTRHRNSKSGKKASLAGWKVQNNFDDGIEAEAEAEAEVERNVSPEIIRKTRKCSLGRQQDASEIRQDDFILPDLPLTDHLVSQILRPSTRNSPSNSETDESRFRAKTLGGINNTANGTLISKFSTPKRVNSVASVPKSRNDQKQRNKENRDVSLIISQQTPRKIDEENDRSSSIRLISNGKHQVFFNLPANKSKTEMPSSSVPTCSVAEEDEILQPAAPKRGRRKRNWNSKDSTMESFTKRTAYNTSHPLASISEINILPTSGTGRSLRVRKTRNFEIPEELEKDGFVLWQGGRKLYSTSKISTVKSKKRVSKKSSILEDQGFSVQEANVEGALSPIKETYSNENVVPGSTIENEDRFDEMPPPRTVPPKRKALAVKNSEVSFDSGFETSNGCRKIGKISSGSLKMKAVSGSEARFSGSERDFRVSEQESNVLSRVSSPIHHTFDLLEPDENSARTDKFPVNSPLRPRTREKCTFDLPLNKYKRVGDAYVYKLYNSPDKQCEVGYLRLEGGEETLSCVFGDYSSVALAVKLGTGFVTIEDKSFPAKIDDWFHVFKGQKYTIRNTNPDQYLKVIYMKLQ